MSDEKEPYESSLEGQLLIAMPAMGDPRFERSVIYMCAHGPDGAMGLIINKRADEISFPALLKQLKIKTDPGMSFDIPVQSGGPVETTRGFVLHSTDYEQSSTLRVSPQIGLTATVDVLRKIAHGRGPEKALLALGYAGWSAGQLEDEITANGWLHGPADPDLLFGADIERKWEKALAQLGIDPLLLSQDAGHA
ncbi:MAG: YqgE/AlgH family protein [Alphaproteobacteria bacterium]